MKKVFVSMPMRGRSEKEILAGQDRVLNLLNFGESEPRYELADSYLGKSHVEHTPLENLGESLRRMANVDLVVSADGWEDARGCRIEHTCAKEYGIPLVEEKQILRAATENLAMKLHDEGDSGKTLDWGEISDEEREKRRAQACSILESAGVLRA